MLGYCRSLKHLKTGILNHGAWVFKQAAEEKATRYRLWCLLNMPEVSRQSFSFYAETDISNVKLILHSYTSITNIKDEISFRLLRMRWTPFRHSGKESGLSSMVSLQVHEPQNCLIGKSKFTKQEDFCKCDQFCVDTFSLPVSPAATGSVPIPIPRALTMSTGLALWPVQMFTISCSSYLNGWIIWLLMTPVILFTPSFRLACWCPRGAWCHPDSSVAWPLSALTLPSELYELASISPWLLADD